MDPILKVIFYLLKKKEISIKVDSINSFFDSGILFPDFVALALNVDSIPNINSNPVQKKEKDENNKIALQFLLSNNKQIAKTKPNYKNELNQYNLLVQILTKQCFTTTDEELLYKCNYIVDDLGIEYSNIKDLLSWKSLLTLLKSLSNILFQEESNDTENSYNFVHKCFMKSKAPLVIDEHSLEEKNRFLFIIQILILIEYYSEIITDSSTTSSSSGDESVDSETDTDANTDSNANLEIEGDNISEEQKMQNLLPKNYKEVEEKEKKIEEEEENEEEKLISSMISQKFASIKIDAEEVNDYNSDEDETPTKSATFSKDQNVKLTKKKSVITFKLYQDMREKALLNTLNSISESKNMKIKFETIVDTIKNDWIPKFVMKFLNLNSIFNVYLCGRSISNSKELSDSELRNINATIEYLKTIESKFKVLTFNFHNVNFYESSAILFYTTFLNYFFLKRSRKEIFERCVTILFPTDNKNKDEFLLLTEWTTYVNLTYFALSGKTLAKISDSKEHDIFEKSVIPMIFDKEYLISVRKYNEIPDEIYYQLQFIFYYIEKLYRKSLIYEYFRIATSKLKEIRVPRIDFITASIRAKNISLILQMRRHKQYIIENQKKETEETEKKLENHHLEKEEEDFDDDDDKAPVTYAERLLVYSNRNLSKKKGLSIQLVKFETADEYWNSPNKDYTFEGGILINKLYENGQAEVEFKNEIDSVFGKSSPRTKEKKDIQKSPQKAELFDSSSFHNVNSEADLYKLFVYSEKEKKWMLNHSEFELMRQMIFPNPNSIKTPFVLFMNSSEKELITINSKLINSSYPDVDESKSQIYVYALCDQLFGQLNYEVDKKNKKKNNIKPIFLLLHVPKEKEDLPDIQCIVTSIYTFLSFFCDLKIVLLDKRHYKSQIELVEIVSKINSNFDIKIVKKQQKRTKESASSSPVKKIKSPLKSFNKAEYEEDFIDEIIDSDDDDRGFYADSSSNSDEDEMIDFGYEKEREINSSGDRLVITENSTADKKTVFLINKSDHEFNENDDQNLNNSHFFNDLVRKVNNETMTFHFIDINQTVTFKIFREKLNEILIETQSSFSERKEIIESIPDIRNTTTFYISMLTHVNWISELEVKLKERYLMFQKNQPLVVNFMAVATKLQKEISMISLPFDSGFQNESKKIISSIKNKINQDNRKALQKELEKSSKLKLNGLNRFEDYEFLSPEKVQNIINEHTYFIKEEYFCLLQNLYDSKNLNLIYEENIDILTDRLINDISAINDYVKEKKMVCQNKYNEPEKDYGIDTGTNYSIREAVNVREIKVQIELGQDLTSEIGQDF